MIYLAPIGGFIDSDFGILTSPSMRGIPSGIKFGMTWAADNNSFKNDFNPDKYLTWLDKFTKYKSTCLFITCPDMVGNSKDTNLLFYRWYKYLDGWPIAFVAQDGQELIKFPNKDLWQALFIGGTSRWKMSGAAISCIEYAKKLGKHIHIGRVNYYRRYKHFASIEGSENFTCDGTRIAYEKSEAVKDWRKYMASPKQFRLELP
jgi:hypothetical protein